jgi:hypothetical protein
MWAPVLRKMDKAGKVVAVHRIAKDAERLTISLTSLLSNVPMT